LNPAAEQLTGWDLLSAAGARLDEIFQIVQEETRQRVEYPIVPVLREGRVVKFANHLLILTRTGKELNIDDSASPLREQDGRIIGAVLVLRDVSEKRQWERESGRLAALLASSEDAIVGQSLDGTVLTWNQGAELLYQFTADEVVGRPLTATIVPADRAQEWANVLRGIIQGTRIEPFETIRVRKDGRRMDISIRVSAIRDAEQQIFGISEIDRDVSPHRAAERRRNARLAVTHILAQESEIDAASPRILAAIGQALGWDCGAFWTVDERQQMLRCREFWHEPSRNIEEFIRATRSSTFVPGVGLPGRVWLERKAAWIPDAALDTNFPRAQAAANVNLHAAFGCPVMVGEDFLGVIEFFSREIQEPDADLLEMMATVGHQIGQFLERRGAEQRLQASEQELADFFENAPVGLHWVGPDGIILRANKAELEMLGYTREEYLGQHISTMHADESVIDDVLQRLANAETLINYEARLRCKDGSIKEVLIASNSLWENGQFIHSRCFTRDISDRKQLDEELRLRLKELVAAEERIRSIVDNALDAIITIDDRGIMQTFNPAAERLFGRMAEDVIGQNVKILMPEPYHREDDNDIALFLQTDEPRILGSGREVMGRRRDGGLIPIELAVSEFHLHNKRFFTGIVHDITQRKRTEATLRFLADASKLLSSIVDYRATLQRVVRLAVPDFADWCAMDMLNADGSLERIAIAHRDAEKLRQIEDHFQRHPVPADSPFGAPRVARTGVSEMSTHITDDMLRSVAADEPSLTFLRDLGLRSYLCVPLVTQAKVLGVLTFVLSESGREYNAHDLTVAEDLAHRAVVALENARLYQQVREADRRKDEFLAMLAHELRNPLAPIRSGLDILAVEQQASGETIGIMQQQVDHLVRLVDDLLDVSRIMRGKIELRRRTTDLLQIVAQACDAIRPILEADNKTLVVRTPPNSIWIYVDPVRIVQVLENLLNNAVKYTDVGGRVELIIEQQDKDAVVRVRDNGIGIEPDLLPKVFDLFIQASRSLDRAQGGLGIGLTLVRTLVELHGGEVTATSAGLKQGSEFTVRLPLGPTSNLPESVATEPESAPARRILVVDDNLGAARLLAALLRKLGPHEVELAHDGPAALAHVQQMEPDIVLLDIGLPGMDGYEVAQAIRGAENGRRILLVAVTGYGQDEDLRRSAEAGFDEHVVKPASVEMLANILTHPKLARSQPGK
ncbi:MAG: PAS domain S-box protein, partial [Planctomycetia bacterium]|nr:PAS domain S-box protein [Planctomycetia bacterium]